jgi:hypothetical protein
MEPTPEQMKQIYRLCYSLTKYYLSIELVTIDSRTSNLIFLAGEETEVHVSPDGEVTIV